MSRADETRKEGRTNMKYRQVGLTPELAREWLETMPEYQRKPSMQVVAEYASDMENGRWVEGTGDAIRFNKNGQMIDGQHRCLAVIESGCSIVVTVIEGLDNEVFMVLDRGKKRTAANTISGNNASVRAAIAKVLIALNNGTTNAQVIGGNTSKKEHPISANEIAEYANEHDELIGSLIACFNKIKSASNGRFSSAVTTCLIAAIIEKTGSFECAERFFSELTLPVSERPIILTMAREKAAAFTVTKGKNKNILLFAIYWVAFQNWLKLETPKIIQTSAITRDVNAVPLKRDWA